MGHGLGSDTDSDLSSAPPSPRLALSPPPLAPSSLPPPSPPPTRERSHSSATEPPWKTRPRPKRQPSMSVPNPPSSPKRRKRVEKEEKGQDVVGGKVKGQGLGRGGKAVGKTQVKEKDSSPAEAKDSLSDDDQRAEQEEKGKDVAVGGKPKGRSRVRAVGKMQVKKDSPPAEVKETLSDDDKASSSKVAPAPWKRTAKPKISPPPPPEPEPEPEPTTSKAKPPPFAKSTPKPKNGITSKPPFNSSKSAPSESKPAPSPKPVPSSTKPTRTTKRPVYNESTESDEEEVEKPKRHKRRKSNIEATPKQTRKPRPSLPAHPTPKAKSKLEPGPVELRPASFLTKTSSFLTKAIVPTTGPSVESRPDVWSYDDLTGLTWVKLDIHKCEIVPGNEQAVWLGEQWCWWPAEVKQNTSNGLKLAFCGLGIERELVPSVADETNVLTFRKPNCSSVRFPTFKAAIPPTKDDESPPAPGEQTSDRPATGSLTPPPNEPSIIPTSPAALETMWKQALACAFKIDTESNDGLEDIFLLFSQKSKSPREDDEVSGNTALEEEEEEEQEEDILENGMTVLCRYRTRYYPAKIISYHPREGKSKRRPGLKGKYKCAFADDSTKLAARREIMTTLDDGFVICPLGTYKHYTGHSYEKPSGVREPSPAPRAHSPAPELEDCTIDPEEYCSRERMRDQLKPVLPFLKGLIERSYIPGKGVVNSTESSSKTEPPAEETDNSSKDPDASIAKDLDNPLKEDPDQPELEPVLDRHAIFMQGGRARKNLAYSVHTGDLNEDDCEELMFEISRWALRGERWACEGTSKEGEGASQEPKEGESTSLKVQDGEEDQQPLSALGDGSSSQGAQHDGGTTVASEIEIDALVTMEDVDMQDATTEADEVVATTEQGPHPDVNSGDVTELEGEPLKVVKILERDLSTTGDFHSLVKLQPPRPVGAPDYEGLTPEDRMGYVSDVLYPEAAALILSYRRGIRTRPGPLADPAAEYALYTAGLQAAKNTCSTSDWVEQILAVRQLRQANSKYHVEEQTQVVVPGGTKSRPKYVTSVLK